MRRLYVDGVSVTTETEISDPACRQAAWFQGDDVTNDRHDIPTKEAQELAAHCVEAHNALLDLNPEAVGRLRETAHLVVAGSDELRVNLGVLYRQRISYLAAALAALEGDTE